MYVEYKRAFTKAQVYRYASEIFITEKGECLQQRKQFWNGYNSRLQENIMNRVEKDALSAQALLAYQHHKSILKKKDLCVTYECKS
jgi:hypothetical protein